MAHRKSLYLPALRAQMGDRIYYISFMSMKDVTERVSVTDVIHESEQLNDLIQQQLSARAPEFKDYLLEQNQRFFGAFVIGVYGGHPNCIELEVESRPHIELDNDTIEQLNGSIGILILNGNEKLFALDGRHRVAGIRQALDSAEEIGAEEVTAIFVSHSNDEQGLARTRRLFATLNRYAKPLNKRETIALDEDDAVAVITRELVGNYPSFHDRVNTHRSKSIPTSDKKNITTVITLYDALDFYLKCGSARQWNKFKQTRPPEAELQEMSQRSKYLWDCMNNSINALSEYSASDRPAEAYRHNDGGHLLFRPIGFMTIVKAMKWLESQVQSTQEAADRIGQVPMELQNPPWLGLLWNQRNKRMITAKENQDVATALLLYGAGGHLTRLKTSTTNLKEDLAGLLNRSSKDVELRRYIEKH